MSSQQEPQDAADLADDFPSPEPSTRHLPTMDMSSELANQAAAQAIEEAVAATASSSDQARLRDHDHDHDHSTNNGHHTDHHRQRVAQHAHSLSQSQSQHASHTHTPYRTSPPQLSNAEQIVILREFYARNPNPGRRDLEMLAERTGRPWNKIREYFRQRRNKLRGLEDLERMEEPGRASGWLQVTYRVGPPTSHVSQLNLYNSYKARFDPYSSHTALLGGQELIQLACATFPGCEMAKDEDDYVLKGLKMREGVAEGGENEAWDRGTDGLVEPLRAGAWLLSSFQHTPDGGESSSITQTDLYTSYAARFSSLLPAAEDGTNEAQGVETADEAELREFEAEMAGPEPGPIDEHDIHSLNLALNQPDDITDDAPPPKRDTRLLNPVELITLTRMTFPKCEPLVDEEGRFIIRGLERREGVEKGRNVKVDDMFPFALASAPSASDPHNPLTLLLKRKLGLLHPDPEPAAKKQKKTDEQLSEEDRELLEGLKRFRGSALGKEVRDVCISQ